MSFFKTARPFIIAGPCSAETKEQVMTVAEALAGMNVQLMRAGVWKPRTRPGAFEGNGAVALEWLREAKQQYNIPITIEVATPEHVEMALQNGVDVLWLGARTVVNPFQVQRLADALKGVDIPVMVKNPVSPDVDLWQGAIERMEKAGITQVAAIHRGFSGYAGAAGYRNQPNWPIPIELKRRKPDLCMIGDPSHITGDRNRVAEVAQKVLDMHFDGLMIETHPDPENAWSDAAQQVTPARLAQILAGLVVREENTHDMSGQEQLEYLRQLMDTLDAEIVDLVARRMELSGKIGAVKKGCNMTVFQPARWSEIVETRGARGAMQGLTPEFVTELYERIHHESIRIQLSVMADQPAKDSAATDSTK
ncbi:MAG: bifunctional 3-deoxy-7-phosphoheptulonate synthase/chorismate mutase type II [Taibaiella sp.]|nr:bifunctional 3-deoxy-7-phosphoheptulonate synthase/chorismate mutase type II [Taibaiella sp.]